MIDIAAFMLSLRDASIGEQRMRLSPSSEHRSVTQRFDRLGASHYTIRDDVDASTNLSRSEYRLPFRTMPQPIYRKCHDDIALTLSEQCAHHNTVLRADDAFMWRLWLNITRTGVAPEQCHLYQIRSDCFENFQTLWKTFSPKLSGSFLGTQKSNCLPHFLSLHDLSIWFICLKKSFCCYFYFFFFQLRLDRKISIMIGKLFQN